MSSEENFMSLLYHAYYLGQNNEIIEETLANIAKYLHDEQKIPFAAWQYLRCEVYWIYT